MLAFDLTFKLALRLPFGEFAASGRLCYPMTDGQARPDDRCGLKHETVCSEPFSRPGNLPGRGFLTGHDETPP